MTKYSVAQIEWIRELFRTRMTMLVMNAKIREKTFQIPMHLGLGHEAIAVAVSQSKKAQDCLVLSHRNMHYNVANQLNTKQIFDEYLLRTTGMGGGKYGSMNLINPDKGLVYTSSILGNNLCVASGIAKANAVTEAKNGTDASVTIVVTGDGAMEEGAFYEALLMAKTSKVPMIVIVENNGWSMYTQIEERRFPIDLAGLTQSMNIPYHQLQGNDVVQYTEQFCGYREQAIAERTPIVIEVLIHTLGDYWTEAQENAPSRLINYHHGLAPKIHQISDVILERNDSDAIFVSWQQLDAEEQEAQSAWLASCFQGFSVILEDGGK